VVPSFSIIIPSYCRPTQLAECLRALSRLEYPRDRFEVIVVDDGGDAPLDDVVAPFGCNLSLALLRQPNAGPAAARNLGAERARGELLAFTDDDCLPDPCWLTALADTLGRAPDCMVGGAVVNAATGRLCSVTSQLITDLVYRHYNADPLHARFLASNNLALSLRGFREIGGFDPGFRTSEDRELCDRWLHRGRRILYHPAALVRHAHHLNVWSFSRQHFGYGRGAAHFHRLRATRQSGSLLADSRFHLDIRNWLHYPLTTVPIRQVVPVAALLVLWQITNLAGFLSETIRRNLSTIRDRALSPSR
jgi:glycosyltransferase involved in cell wall biosynthesis